MPTAVIRIDVNPVLQLGPLAIHWYGIMYAIAFWAGWRFAVRPFLRSHAVADADIERMLAWVILFGLLGARLYYVVQQDLGSYLRHPVDIIAVWNGGMAFFGAIIAGLLTIAVLAWRNRLSMWMLMDAGVLFAVVGQPIGRIGNIINGDILGTQSSLPWATAYTYVTGQTADGAHCAVLQPGFSCGVPYQPAAAYEAIATILIGLVLYALLRRRVAAGVLTITYVALYAVSQLVVFQWRDSEPVVGLGLKQAQWTAVAVLLLAVPLLVALHRRGVGAFDRRPPAVAEGDPSGARGVESAASEAGPGGTG